MKLRRGLQLQEAVLDGLVGRDDNPEDPDEDQRDDHTDLTKHQLRALLEHSIPFVVVSL